MILILNICLLAIILVLSVYFLKNLNETKRDKWQSRSEYNLIYMIIISTGIILLLFVNSIIDRSILVSIVGIISLIKAYFIIKESKA